MFDRSVVYNLYVTGSWFFKYFDGSVVFQLWVICRWFPLDAPVSRES